MPQKNGSLKTFFNVVKHATQIQYLFFMRSIKECRSSSLGIECGIVSGLTQSFLFNSYDRALYNSIVNHTSFLDPANWKGNPFSGVSPSFLQRAFSTGLYFPLEDAFRRNVSESDAVDGVLVGLVGGLFTTPFNAVKYAMWSHSAESSARPTVWRTGFELYKNGGVSRLMRGAVPTLMRDMTFGLTFSSLRHQGDGGFMVNMGAACIATAVSSPFNYVRMKVYAPEKGETRKTSAVILEELGREVAKRRDVRAQAMFLFSRLNVGWGAMRVGLGMGLGSQIYSTCCR